MVARIWTCIKITCMSNNRTIFKRWFDISMFEYRMMELGVEFLLFVVFFLASFSISFRFVAFRCVSSIRFVFYLPSFQTVHRLFFFITVIGCSSVCLCHCSCYPNANGYFRLFIIRLKFSFPIQLHWNDLFSMCRPFNIYVRMLHMLPVSVSA